MPSFKARVKSSVANALVTHPARSADARARAAAGPLVVAGLFRTASGVGESARSCSDALTAFGRPHCCVDLSGPFNQIDLAPDRALGAMPADANGTLILHVNAPETMPALRALRLYRRGAWRIIGCWVWELEAAPPDWAGPAQGLSEIWAPSTFCAEAFRQLTPLPVRLAPYRVLPPADLPPPPPHEGIVVLTMADGRSSLARKNIDGAIRVFLSALGDREDCRLIVKTRNLSEFPGEAAALRRTAQGHPRIAFADESLSPRERWRLIASADILLSLHRAEGFGLTVAEAMALGKSVIATGWSGNLDFTPASAQVPFHLTPVTDETGAYRAYAVQRWAAPDEAVAAQMLHAAAAAHAKSAHPPPAATMTGAAYIEALDAAAGDAAVKRSRSPERE